MDTTTTLRKVTTMLTVIDGTGTVIATHPIEHIEGGTNAVAAARTLTNRLFTPGWGEIVMLPHGGLVLSMPF